MIGAVLLDTDSGDRVTLQPQATTFGRTESNDVTLTGSGVSRFHAVIESVPNQPGHLLRDLQSRNGTFVNGDTVGTEGTRLADGDLIVFAGSCAFRYLDPQATPLVPRLGQTDGVWIDPTSHQVWVDARPVSPPLSVRQHNLLVLLVEADGRTISRPDVVARIWDDVEAVGVSDDAVSALVKRLRARLRETGKGGEFIEVVRGRGFRLIR